MDMYFLVVLLALLIFVIYKKIEKGNLPPGPRGLPILGYLPWLDKVAPYLKLTELSEKYGPIYGMNLGTLYTVVVTDPKITKKLFSMDETTGRAPLYLTHGIMKGYGLICAEGELWKEQRRFTHHYLRKFGCSRIGPQRRQMESLISRNVLEFIEYVENIGDRAILDPLEPLRHSIGNAINLLVFGTCWSRDDKTWKWLQHLQEEGTQHLGVAGILNFFPFLRFIPKYRRTMTFLLDGQSKTHKLYEKIIENQNNELIKSSINSENGELNPTNFTQAFLVEKKKSDALTAERFYNNQQFLHLLADLFGAGLDTTLTTLRWYLLFLAKYTNIQNSVRNEIKEVIKDRLPSIEDMPYLPLVEASILEAQRIRPVTPLGIPHSALRDINVNDYSIPKGTMIMILQWAVHMDPKAWDNPEKFDPWRFLNEEGKITKPDHFMPFQMGKRMCVGDELARMLLFLFVTTILQRFTLSLGNEDVDLTGDCGITLTPKSHKILFSKVLE